MLYTPPLFPKTISSCLSTPGPQYGRGASGTASSAQSATHDPRWQHPEKQKTLIHTAPVLSPTKMMGGSSDSSGWARGGKDQNAVNMEVSITVELKANIGILLLLNALSFLFIYHIIVGAYSGGVRGSCGGNAKAERRCQTLAPPTAGTIINILFTQCSTFECNNSVPRSVSVIHWN